MISKKTDNIKVITIFDKHEDFIGLQYNSIIKHVKGEYEYIVFNNASTQIQADKNQVECERLGIKCIRIVVNYNAAPSNIAGEALNEAFKHVSDEFVFKIDSDMFFISDINLSDLFSDDLIYIPNYQPNREIMWSGVFGLNLKKIDIQLDFNPSVVPQTDTFGQSCLLTKDLKYYKKLFELYGLQDIKDGIIITSLNNDCGISFKDNDIIFNEKPEMYFGEKIPKNLHTKYVDIIETLKRYEFPQPYNIDVVAINGVDFIFHFKSSNWCPWYSEEYVNEKKEALTKYLNNI